MLNFAAAYVAHDPLANLSVCCPVRMFVPLCIYHIVQSFIDKVIFICVSCFFVCSC